MKEIRFFVPGKPAPGGSKTAFAIKKGGVYTGRAIVIDAAGQANKDWRANVVKSASEAMKQRGEYPWTCAIELELIFRLPRPKGHFRSNGIALRPSAPKSPTIRPDVGKLARSTQDALTNVVYRDDAQIVKETHEKVYSEQIGCWVTIRDADQTGETVAGIVKTAKDAAQDRISKIFGSVLI